MKIKEIKKAFGKFSNNKVPVGIIIQYVLSKATRHIWGIIRFRRIMDIELAPSTSIIGIKYIRTNGKLVIDSKSYINAISHEGLQLGNNVIIGRQTTISCCPNPMIIGKGISIGNNTSLGTHGFYGGMGGLIIGNDVLIGNYVSFHPENHRYDEINTLIRKQGVYYKGGIKIGNNCWIGAKVTFLDGSSIGDGCIVAAGSVVTKKFPDNVIIGGIPAKIIRVRK